MYDRIQLWWIVNLEFASQLFSKQIQKKCCWVGPRTLSECARAHSDVQISGRVDEDEQKRKTQTRKRKREQEEKKMRRRANGYEMKKRRRK